MQFLKILYFDTNQSISVFNHNKIDHRNLVVDEKRDFYSQGMEGTVMKTVYRGQQVRIIFKFIKYFE